MASFFSRDIGTADVIVLMRNLAMTLKAGVPIMQALQMFELDARGQRRTVIKHLRQSVESGQSLSVAMETSPSAFPSIAIHLVKVGELSGTLVENLQALVSYLQRSQDLRRKIRSAMLYPTFVLVACLGLGLSVGTLVLPELLPLFTSLDVTLPFSTRVLIAVSAFFRDYGILTSIIVALLVVAIVFASRFERVKPLIYRFYLSLPYIKTVQKQTAIAQFCSTLAILLQSGVAVREAIPASAQAVENRIFRAAILDAIGTVEGGHTLSEGLRRGGSLFPDMTLSLIAIGEETGTLSQTLAYLSSFYQDEVDYAVKGLTTSLEPILLIGIGLFVGFTIMAIITPLYDVTGSLN